LLKLIVDARVELGHDAEIDARPMANEA